MRKEPIVIRNMRLVGAAIVSTVLLTGLFQSSALLKVQAGQEECHYFAQTGRAACGPFLTFWQNNGGLRIFGYPISNELFEQPVQGGDFRVVQYFERGEFELHPENNPPYDVQLALIGTYKYQSKYHARNVADTIPTYPRTSNLKVSQLDAKSPDILVTSFQTADKPDVVLAYYKDALQISKWDITISNNNLRAGNSMPSNESACDNPTATIRADYDLSIDITLLPKSGSDVKLFLKTSYGRR